MKASRSMLPVTLLNLLSLFLIGLRLPATVPIHVDIHMQINGYGSKWMIVIIGLLPVAAAVGMRLYRRVTKNNPVIRQNQKVENILFPMIVAFLMVVSWLPVLVAFQYNTPVGMPLSLPVDFIIAFPVGVFMIAISNFMGVVKPNRLLGIRVPWTLANEKVWKKTHRLGGHTGVIGGVLICVFTTMSFALHAPVLSIIGFLLGMAFVVLIPVIYSYVLYKKMGL